MKVRVTFSKTGPLRYIGNLDLLALWERAVRRAGLPLTYSQGFHPQPKISLGAALPLGFSSRCELVDLRFNEEVDLATLPGILQAAMPAGIGIIKVEGLDDHAPAMQTQIVSVVYEVTLKERPDPADLNRRLEQVMHSPSLPRQRRGKDFDLRPLIEDLSLEAGSTASPDQAVKIRMQLASREGATGRPEDVLDVLGIEFESTQVERTGLIFRK